MVRMRSGGSCYSECVRAERLGGKVEVGIQCDVEN